MVKESDKPKESEIVDGVIEDTILTFADIYLEDAVDPSSTYFIGRLIRTANIAARTLQHRSVSDYDKNHDKKLGYIIETSLSLVRRLKTLEV